MRTPALLLLLLSLSASAQSGGVFRRNRPEDTKRKPALGLLVGGPSSAQTGTGTLTGSRGETVTTTRASSRTCVRADGAVVTLGNDSPCVQTQGLSIESSHTNLLLRSQAFDNAAWADSNTGGPAVPTTTADAAVAPDGTTTADRIDIPAVGAAQASARVQTFTATADPYTFTVWAKAVSGTPSTYIFLINNVTGAIAGQLLISPSASTWTRYAVTATLSAGVFAADIGVRTVGASTQSPQSASSIFYWQAQVTAKPYAQSDIPTAGTTATTLKDVVSMSATALPAASGRVDLSFTPLWSTNAGATLIDTRSGVGANGLAIYVVNTAATCILGSTSAVTSSALTWTPGTAYRVRCVWGAGNLALFRDDVPLATITNGSATMPSAHTTFRLGDGFAAASPLDGYLSDIRWYR